MQSTAKKINILDTINEALEEQAIELQKFRKTMKKLDITMGKTLWSYNGLRKDLDKAQTEISKTEILQKDLIQVLGP